MLQRQLTVLFLWANSTAVVVRVNLSTQCEFWTRICQSFMQKTSISALGQKEGNVRWLRRCEKIQINWIILKWNMGQTNRQPDKHRCFTLTVMDAASVVIFKKTLIGGPEQYYPKLATVKSTIRLPVSGGYAGDVGNPAADPGFGRMFVRGSGERKSPCRSTGRAPRANFRKKLKTHLFKFQYIFKDVFLYSFSLFLTF